MGEKKMVFHFFNSIIRNGKLGFNEYCEVVITVVKFCKYIFEFIDRGFRK